MPRKAALLAAALVACASRPGSRPAASSGQRASFVIYPAEVVAAVRDPHAYRGEPLCQRCHDATGRLVAAPSALCRECHAFGHSSHPVDVVQRGPSGALPLLAGGIVACHTCHDPHQEREVLRKPFNELCTSCHAPHGRGG